MPPRLLRFEHLRAGFFAVGCPVGFLRKQWVAKESFTGMQRQKRCLILFRYILSMTVVKAGASSQALETLVYVPSTKTIGNSDSPFTARFIVFNRQLPARPTAQRAARPGLRFEPADCGAVIIFIMGLHEALREAIAWWWSLSCAVDGRGTTEADSKCKAAHRWQPSMETVAGTNRPIPTSLPSADDAISKCLSFGPQCGVLRVCCQQSR